MASSSIDTSWVSELYGENFLAVYDVVLDIKKELQFGAEVVIPIFQPILRFPQLMPADGINLRDRYCELRWKAANLLKQRGAIASIEVLKDLHRWDSRLKIVPTQKALDAVEAALEVEYQRRKGPQGAEVAAAPPDQPLEQPRRLILRFHSVVIQLRQRYDGRPTLDVTDEFDVQDLLHALLRLYFDDVRPEEWTPSYAGRSSRVDFLLKPEKIVVEVKKTRLGLGSKEIGDQLIIDSERYSKMDSCETLVCMVYDQENRIANPGGFQADISGERGGLKVEVIVVPKQY